MNTPRTRFYRDKANGKLMGVCSGMGNYAGMDAFWIRLGFIIFTLTMGWPLLLYFAAGFIAPKKPEQLYHDRQEEKFWQDVRKSPSASARQVKGKFRDIDRRLARVEEHYVSSNRALSAEIERLR
ncbi:envelope stress response membrane protein PspC [uncultured Croceicoccus sp.]|uniref:envelope stress response membrane protein PspC n=1 Tax=uncultured Croceicoccus sp. TaxID=1295329 RepID=UPI00262C70F2|nr:envelope stress response membrane protein PspC [uncultured Croceicoccus sp.]